jgi:hypothetical protein
MYCQAEEFDNLIEFLEPKALFTSWFPLERRKVDARCAYLLD